MRGLINGGSVLVPGGAEPVAGSLAWEGETITAVGPGVVGAADLVVEAAGCYVLPGIVDIHGDAFERALMPRPGVPVAMGPALDDNDRMAWRATEVAGRPERSASSRSRE